MPSRRALLAACSGGIAALAGCAGRFRGSPDAGATDTATPAPVPTGTPASVGGERRVGDSTVTVKRAAARSTVVHLSSADSMDVATADGRFLLARVEATEPAPGPDAFSLVADGTTYDRTDAWYREPVVVGSLAATYRAESGEGWLAFEVPAPLSADRTRVTCGDARWRLPDAVVDALARPVPSWTLRSFEVPAELEPGEEFAVRVAVENVGDADATFRGALNVANLNYAYYPYPFAVGVPAGERATWTKRLSVPGDMDPGAEPDFYLRTPAGDRRATATVVVGTARGTATDG